MAAIVAVVNGVTVEDAVHFNQFKDAFNAILGVTDSAQDALGRLVLPQGTSLPGSPTEGMEFWKTDAGDNGRLQIRDGNGVWVPYMPLRQYVEGTEVTANQTITSTSFTDATGLTLSITTTGGRIEIGIRPANGLDVNGGSMLWNNSGGTPGGAGGSLRAVVGATELGQIDAELTGDANSVLWAIRYPVSAYRWIYRPAAGTYTVKLQAKVQTNGRLQYGASGGGGIALYCLEFSDS